MAHSMPPVATDAPSVPPPAELDDPLTTWLVLMIVVGCLAVALIVVVTVLSPHLGGP